MTQSVVLVQFLLDETYDANSLRTSVSEGPPHATANILDAATIDRITKRDACRGTKPKVYHSSAREVTSAATRGRKATPHSGRARDGEVCRRC